MSKSATPAPAMDEGERGRAPEPRSPTAAEIGRDLDDEEARVLRRDGRTVLLVVVVFYAILAAILVKLCTW